MKFLKNETINFYNPSNNIKFRLFGKINLNNPPYQKNHINPDTPLSIVRYYITTNI